MSDSRIDGNVHVNGHLSAKTMSFPASSVENATIEAAAGIDASKLEHRHQLTYSQARGVDNADARTIIHLVNGATATIQSFKAKNAVTAASSDTTTVDLLKNGSTILSAVISLAAADTTTVKSAAGFTSTSLVQGDVLEVVINATGGDPGEGVAAFLVLDEDAA